MHVHFFSVEISKTAQKSNTERRFSASITACIFRIALSNKLNLLTPPLEWGDDTDRHHNKEVQIASSASASILLSMYICMCMYVLWLSTDLILNYYTVYITSSSRNTRSIVNI